MNVARLSAPLFGEHGIGLRHLQWVHAVSYRGWSSDGLKKFVVLMPIAHRGLQHVLQTARLAVNPSLFANR